MSTLTSAHAHGPADQAHPDFLAHHFKTPEQQYASGKLGMWIFIGTELLMFGGLFCAYAVYRALHPDIFEIGHLALNKTLGAVNTIILIAASFFMAWAVRLAQTNRRKGLIVCLLVTFIGGGVFMGIKGYEWFEHYHEGLWIGRENVLSPGYTGKDKLAAIYDLTEDGVLKTPPVQTSEPKSVQMQILAPDPNAGTSDAALDRPPFIEIPGMKSEVIHQPPVLSYSDLSSADKERMATFFNIYYVMTGLHGIHVLVAMGLIVWLLIGAMKNRYTGQYFTPVDLVGLYWHFVDIIWIFLFPLLYLIH